MAVLPRLSVACLLDLLWSVSDALRVEYRFNEIDESRESESSESSEKVEKVEKVPGAEFFGLYDQHVPGVYTGVPVVEYYNNFSTTSNR